MSAASTVVGAAQKATNFANQTVETARFEVIKEPLGFIKILQFFFAILAFSIAVNGSSSSTFTITCSLAPATSTSASTTAVPPTCTGYIGTYQGNFGYPYDLNNSPLQITNNCPAGCTVPMIASPTTITQSASNLVSSSQFFVFVGVTSFLYSLFMGIVYVFFRHKYSNILFFPLIDFGVTCLWTLFWFAGAIAWAKAVSDIQYYTNPENIISSNSICAASTGNKCNPTSYATYANIIVSAIIGFGNFILWTGDIWFVLKETTWYKTRQEIQRQSQNVTNNPISPNDITISATYNPNNKI